MRRPSVRAAKSGTFETAKFEFYAGFHRQSCKTPRWVEMVPGSDKCALQDAFG